MDLSRFYNQFREETTENIRIFSDGLLAIEQMSGTSDPSMRERLDAIFRAMHTIKGSSRLLGFGAIGRLAHTMEHILGAVREGSHTLDRTLIDDMLKSGDALLEMTIAAVEGGSTSINVDQIVAKLNASLEAKTAEQPTVLEKPPVLPEKPPVVEEPSKPKEPPPKVEEPPKEPPPKESPVQPTPSISPTTIGKTSSTTRRQTIRVRVDRLDNLMNLTGELVVGQQMLANHAQVLHELNILFQEQESGLLSLADILHQLRISNDQRQVLDTLTNKLLNIGDQARQLLRGQAEQFNRIVETQNILVNDLEQEVMAVRLQPVSTIFTNLPRAVRELANATSKEVTLEIQGEATELDRKLLEALGDPLMHLIRNAVDHGIELPDERVAIGKPQQGLIVVAAEASGGEVHIRIRDDGRGMDPQKLRQTAIKKGLISKENAELLSDQESLELIFLPGFSSADMITDISGRGVGMDVVRTNITELGGQVSIESQVGVGTQITMLLPLTIVTTRILLIKVGPYTFALPASGCYGIIWVYEQHIRTIEGRSMIIYGDQVIPLLRIGDLLGIETEPSFTNGKREPAVLIGNAQRLMSLIVDQLLDEREAVVKPLGPLFETQRRYGGAVQLGEGQLVLLLNPIDLVQAARGITQIRSTTTKAERQKRPHLLIAEDSFTTRELIRSILQSAGYDVTAAIDGYDALDKLRQQSYDLVVTDVEMPRVDGFELTTRIRQELEEHDMPVVIITSLASDEYRRRGLEAGAQAYIVKSQFNQDNLLRVISQLLGHEGIGH